MQSLLRLTFIFLALLTTHSFAGNNSAVAQRIISLSPHTTELLYSAGAGDKVIAVDADSNYPSHMRTLPKVATHISINIEQILTLKPDLIVDGEGYHTKAVLAQLRSLNIPLHEVQAKSLTDIAASIRTLGQLAGTTAIADSTANTFEERLQLLQSRYADTAPVTVFFQIWFDPLMTIGRSNFVNDAIRLCGGKNIYSEVEGHFPRIGIETLLIADPQLIVAYGKDAQAKTQLQDAWKEHSSLTAVKNNSFLIVPYALLSTPGPRVLEGVSTLCQKLDSIRQQAK